MSVTPTTELMYLKGVGPHRAEMLAKRGMRTFEDLLGYLPFRYEDRIHFAQDSRHRAGTDLYRARASVERQPGALLARARRHVSPAGAATTPARCRANFFTGIIWRKHSKPGKDSCCTGRRNWIRTRPGRIEMINPAYEMLGAGDADSTEVGRIVPIYEAIGGIGSRTIRRIVYQALEKFSGARARSAARGNSGALQISFAARRHCASCIFRRQTESVDALNSFRSPAHQRLIFEEFFFYQLSVALRKKSAQQQAGIAFRVREPAVREALKRVLPFKPTDAQKRVLAEIAADLERGVPMNRLLQGDVGSGKTIVALEAATIVIENGYQAALMAPTEILAVQHYLSAQKNIRARGLPRRAADQRNESVGEKSGAGSRALRRSATGGGNARAAASRRWSSRDWAW